MAHGTAMRAIMSAWLCVTVGACQAETPEPDVGGSSEPERLGPSRPDR